ncbi:MAG: hypothetical protein KFW07_02535 [Mycoplasmataceae bacterium]|nr:hypothetical protein [Mycoplasmataceae bacterium]
MNEVDKKEYINIFEKFVSICSKNNLWYSLANDTLLSAKTDINYFHNNGILEIFITSETFTFLKFNYKKNIIDFTNSDKFYLSTPFFYIKNNNKFIKIIIITPTSIKKVENFCNIKNRIKYNYSNFLTFGSNGKIINSISCFIFKLFSYLFYPIDHKQSYDKLYVENYQGFFAINSLNETPNKNWFPNLTFKREDIRFLSIKTHVFVECNSFLKSRYGETWADGVDIKRSNYDYIKIIK